MSIAQLARVVFLIFFSAEFFLERALSVLNARHVRANADAIPESLAGTLDAETYRKSVAYTLAKNRFGHVAALESAVLKLIVLFSGLLPWLAIQADIGPPYFKPLVFLFYFALFNALAAMPLDLYGTFVLEARFGFNKTDFKTWLADRIKAAIVGAIFGTPFVLAILWLTLNTGPLWWLWVALFVIGYQFVMMILYPTLISPLFNKFTPLEDGPLKQTLHNLARKCGFAVGGIFVMDGSRRSKHSNAYFTGLGKARRIVLYDTLVQSLSTDELAAVLAHEIGHYKLKHIPKGLLLSCVFTLAGFYVLSLILYWPPFYEAFGSFGVEASAWPFHTVPVAHTPLTVTAGLMICSLISGPLTFWIGPVFHALSRKYEYQADAYAANQTSAVPMRGALLKLHESNLSNPTPHPLFSAYHYSHPALLERLGALANEQGGRGAGELGRFSLNNPPRSPAP